MCRIEERVYISPDGSRRTFEESFPCHKTKLGRLCGNIDRRRREYHPKPVVNREGSTSPASFDPPTPTGAGTYLVQQRRPSTVQRRPSTRDGARPLKPEIIIEFGSRKDNKSKKYPAIQVKSYKRTSLGSGSVGSNEAVDSPGSDASFTIRTGLADTQVPLSNPYQQPPGYPVRPVVQHRHTSSTSSFTSSQPPSLYATSEPESPTRPRAPRYPPTIVHNPPSPNATRSIPIPATTGTYRVGIAAPQDSTPRSNIGPDGLFPLDYSEFHHDSNSSRASSGRAAIERAPERSVAPEITDRDAERARLRKLNADAERARQQEADRQMAQKIAQEEAQSRAQEEAKQVRFELDRAESREKERNARKQAEIEKRKAEDRAEERVREEKKDKERIKEKQAKEESKQKRDSRPPTRDTTKRHHTRRPSISQADAQERIRLLAETQAQMAREREATEQREREERAAMLRQQQQTTQYYDPRGGERFPVVNEGSTVGRRNSVSGRRPSLSAPAPPMSSTNRPNAQRRVSIIQPAPPTNLPPINTSFPNPYSTRPPTAQRPAQPTQLFSPAPAGQGYPRPPSARHHSYSQENPFAQPPTRTSQENPFALPSTRTSQENPFAPTTVPGLIQPHDPWDTRNVRDALPQPVEQTLRQRGEEVIKRASDNDRRHDRARQATKNMNKVVGYENTFETSSEENEADKIAGYGSRLGLAKKEKEKKRRA